MALSKPARLFSLREANALVPALQRTFARARALREQLSQIETELSAAGAPVRGPRIDIDSSAAAFVQALQRRGSALAEELFSLLREVGELGIEVKAADGLVDFRSRLRGRIVYLCWRFGEEAVGHYHELEAGFAGRQPLPRDAEFVGDLLH